MTHLGGRVVVVTGASRGVGREIALRLAADGARIAVNYRRDQGAADEVVTHIRRAGGIAGAYQASVDDAEAVLSMVADVHRELGQVSGIVSNAGAASSGRSIAETAEHEFVSQLRVHALGPLGLIRALLPDLRAASRGDIVMISSTTVCTAPPLSAAYTMAKAAMETSVLTLAHEERQHGIRANIVAPGLVMTEMGRRLVRATAGTAIEALDDSAPFGRVCRPSDVAGVVGFLMSEDAGYMTGQRLVVDGGGRTPDVY